MFIDLPVLIPVCVSTAVLEYVAVHDPVCKSVENLVVKSVNFSEPVSTTPVCDCTGISELIDVIVEEL